MAPTTIAPESGSRNGYRKTTQTPEKVGPVIHMTERAAKKISRCSPRMCLRSRVDCASACRAAAVRGSRMRCGWTPRRATATRSSRSSAPASSWIRKAFCTWNGTTLEYEETLMRQGFVFRIPTPHAIAVAGVHSRRSGGTGFGLCAVWVPTRSQVVGHRTRQPLFLLATGAIRLNFYDHFTSHYESTAGLLELPRAHCGNALLRVLRQSTAGCRAQRLFLHV